MRKFAAPVAPGGLRLAAAVVVLLVALVVPVAKAAESGPLWGHGTALTLPVPAHGGTPLSVACPAPGRCVTVGSYTDAHDIQWAMVDSQAGGVWNTAAPLALPAGASLEGASYPTQLDSVACTGVGDCEAVGTFPEGVDPDVFPSGSMQAMVAAEKNGTWGQAVAVPQPANASTFRPYAELKSVSCPGAASCVAVGNYTDSGDHGAAMVAAEVDGSWQQPIEIAPPTNPPPSTTGGASLNSLSCVSAGNCVAVGTYGTTAGFTQAMTVAEVNGVWGAAQELVPPANASTAPVGGEMAGASLASVTCTSPGDCVAVGAYAIATGAGAPMAASEVGGVWGQAVELNPSRSEIVGMDSVTCDPGGDCVAVGSELCCDSPWLYKPLVAVDTSGVWGETGALNLPFSQVQPSTLTSVACDTLASCTAVGYDYSGPGNPSQPIAVGSVPPMSLTTTRLPDATVGTPYRGVVEAIGGSGRYAWRVTNGTLPAGLGLDGSGVISGTPETAGTSTFTVQVTDFYFTAQIVTRTLSITTSAPSAPACVVPQLVHMTLPHARRALLKADCALGRVRRLRHARRSRPDRVVSQSARHRSRHRRGFRVGVTVR